MNNLSADIYLSIVIRIRNDDHGGNMLRRMQVSLNGLLEQLERYRIESELILVEANPPSDKPLLTNIIKWPDRLRYCTIRVVIVSPLVHQRYKYSDKMPMYTIIAGNCGVRRSRGRFILPGTIDALYSEELMAYIASKSLKIDERYRIDRCDVNRDVLACETLSEQLNYCNKNVIKVNGQSPQPKVPWWRQSLDGSILPNLHTQACGDFQLMSKHYWHLLRGYREADFIGAYADTLLSYASYAMGVREVVLKNPMCLYHIDHDDKFVTTIKTEKLPLEDWFFFSFLPVWLNKKLLGLYRRFLILMGYKIKSHARGIPTLEYGEARKMCREMVAGKRSYIFNDENWGLGQDSLEEFVISTADWDRGYEA